MIDLENIHKHFFQVSLDLFCVAGFDGYFKALNPSWETLLGYSQEELLASPFIGFIHPDDIEATTLEVQKLSTGIDTVFFENRYICKDQSIKWLRWSATMALDQGLIYALARDVTLLKEAEMSRRLAAAEVERFSVALKQLYQLSMAKYNDFDHLFHDYIEAGCAFFGLPTGIISEIIGESYTVKAVQSPLGLASGAIFELDNTYCAAVVQTKETVSYAQVGLMPEMLGHPVYQNLKLEAYISAPIFVDTQFYGTLNFSSTTPRPAGFGHYEQELIELMAQNIGRYLYLQQLEVARQTYEGELRNMALFAQLNPSPVMRFDRQGELLAANPVAVALLPAEADLFSLLPELDINLDELIEQKLLHIHQEEIDDRHYQFVIKGIAVNNTIHVYGLDTTDLRQAEAVLAEKATALGRSNTELEQFAYAISHDLRAPLRAMTTYSQFLLEDNGDQLDEEGLEYLSGIAESAQQMEALVVGLLAYSRIGRTRLKVIRVDIGALLAGIVKRLNLEAEAVVLLPENLPILLGQAIRLEQVFSNLLTNAVKFCRPGVEPVVKIECVEGEREWSFSVKDNGIGIKEAYQAQIFGVFQRLHTVDEYDGTGIGLAIVKKAVEDWGGTIQLDSTFGQGTTFTFTVPKLPVGDAKR